jgi:hypothetical protein
MTDNRTIEQRIATWLEGEAVGVLPDRVLESVFTETRVVIRRRSPFDGRSSHVSRFASALVAVGAAAIVLVFGASLLGSKGPATSSPGPSASSAAIAYPTPAPYQTVLQPTLAPSAASPTPEDIDATAFIVPFTMTWPERVELPIVWSDSVQVRPRYGTSFTMLQIGKVGADPCHNQQLTATALTTPQQFMDWLAGIPHVTATPVKTVTVGGKPALQRDLDISPLTDCQDLSQLYSGIHSRLDDGPGGFYFGPGKVEWTAMTVNGHLIAFMIAPLTSPTFVPEANQAVASIRFVP